MQNANGYKWHPLEDLPEDWHGLTSGEMKALSRAWDDQKKSLEASGDVQTFLERLQRQWAIETGIIERVYTLDRGVTQLLIERGIDANLISHEDTDRDPELVAAIIRDQQDVVEGLFDFVKGNRGLSTSYVKELHHALCRNQSAVTAVTSQGKTTQIELLKGAYKQQPNNPQRPDGALHEYCPPEQVASEMDTLIALHQQHLAQMIPPEVEAAWLHHRFTQVHPFQDGNGRVARALASLAFVRAGWFPLTLTREDRDAYIEALEQADAGELRSLVKLFVDIHRRTFIGALGIVSQTLQARQVETVISGIRADFEKQAESLKKEQDETKKIATHLLQVACRRLEAVKTSLESELKSVVPKLNCYVDMDPPDGSRGHYFRHQIVTIAKGLGYWANTREYRAWTRLVMNVGSLSTILVSFHGLGREYRGLVAASVCYISKEESEEGGREIGETLRGSDEIFQVNYRESALDAEYRFLEWLNRALVRALEMWRRSM